MENKKVINISGLAKAANIDKHRLVYAFDNDCKNLDTVERERLSSIIQSAAIEYQKKLNKVKV